MASSRDPALRTPALDFCHLVDAKQRSELGFAVPLEAVDQHRLDELIADAKRGVSHALEVRAKQFLISYREYEEYSRVLTDEERAQLDDILSGSRRFPWPTKLRSVVVVRVVVLLWVVAVAVFGVVTFVHYHTQGSVLPGVTQQYPPAQQVPPGTTALQDFKSDWGLWVQQKPTEGRPQTGQPALLLLESGGYFISASWTVPADSSAWTEDLGGNVNNVDVRGTYADITDSDGNPYIVGINQPFVISSNPNVVLKIDPTGNVLSMGLPKATAIRTSIKK